MIRLRGFVTHCFEQRDAQEHINIIRCDIGRKVVREPIANLVESSDSGNQVCHAVNSVAYERELLSEGQSSILR